MSEIKIKENKSDKRESVIMTLIDNGYKVWVEVVDNKKTDDPKFNELFADYYIYAEGKDE